MDGPLEQAFMTTAQTKHQMFNDDTEHQLVQHYVLNTLFFVLIFLVKGQEIMAF